MERAGDLVDVAVVGAGVVGAAVAARLAARGRSCFVLERRAHAGGETTERNSGVVHAGLYYPRDSLKTRLCVEGSRALYAWAARAGVPHARMGKLIVATSDAEEAAALALRAHGRDCGVEGLEALSAAELARREPEVRGRMAILSAASGIVDPAELTRSLLAAAEREGAAVICSAGVEAIERTAAGYSLRTPRGTVEAAAVVNAAGLYADDVAALAGVAKYRIHPCRGDYFRLAARRTFRHLVYPVKTPGAPGLGVHLTLDLAGGQRLGPDARYVASKADYGPPAEEKRAAFAAAARKILGPVAEEDLAYDTCGIRPKLRAPDEKEERDFVIAEDLPRFVNLVGIESPGLTAALAIAAEVARRLG
jgi:L-2-hydroxyglutarate oxidase LhgO